MKMNDFMVDIETLGTGAHSIICSIAIVQFDLTTGETGEEIEVAIDWQDQANFKAKMDVDTVRWWMKQEPEAIKKLMSKHNVTVKKAAELINKFFEKNCKDLNNAKLWGNSVVFDNIMIRNLYKRHGLSFPLPYWCDADVRTLVAMAQINPKDYEFKGVKHNAIDDCKHQINYCCDGYEQMTEGL